MRNVPQEYESFRNKPTEGQLKRWKNQEKIVFSAFYKEPQTMYMVEKSTGIMRPSICRFVATWKKKDSIRIVRTGKDPFTKCHAQFLSTNPALWPAKPEPKPEPQPVILRNGQVTLFQ